MEFMEINTKTWKKFKVGDLFDCYLGKSPCKQNINETGKYPVISAQTNNNGIIGYTDYEDGNFIYNDKLTLGNRGSYRCFYQGGKFYAGNNVIVFDEKVLMNKFHKLFIAVLINKLDFCGYTKYPTKTNIREEMILLPSKNNEPDWDFMEKYIKEIKYKYIDKIEKLNDENIKKALEVAGLTEEDIDKELVLPVCDRYKEFEIGDLFYAKTRTDIGRMFSKQDFKDSIYDTPALSSTSVNNSIGYYVKMSEHILIVEVCLSITANGAYTGTLYLQTEPFAIAQDAYVLHLKEGLKNRNTYLYFKTLIEKITLQKYNYSNKAGWNKVKKEKILVPIIDENTPNFDFMERYIYIYISIFIKNKKVDNERKVELMRKAL